MVCSGAQNIAEGHRRTKQTKSLTRLRPLLSSAQGSGQGAVCLPTTERGFGDARYDRQCPERCAGTTGRAPGGNSDGCGSGETPIGPSTNPLLEPFVGTWDATALTVQSVADTSIVAGLLENGVSHITTYESGNYQSTIAFGGAVTGAFGMNLDNAYVEWPNYTFYTVCALVMVLMVFGTQATIWLLKSNEVIPK